MEQNEIITLTIYNSYLNMCNELTIISKSFNSLDHKEYNRVKLLYNLDDDSNFIGEDN